ncbi:protein FAR1-RELATED SEQUENCE 3-like [Salvia miltiorrhiza]|uniref:protein FAR1-RELATED SEQUENCE 3-like n=1 Tax=Salvia miltiorrhiza TaxID=226208 RepID=UPI0025ACBD4E|nr:protein FAR1-RELATED SEQUENCE 3-like [Salvia miltiorrhiza]
MKVAEKLPNHLRNVSELKDRFNNIVWSDLVEPSVFEENCHRLMDDYDLRDNRWFIDMFALRANWVPAYFRDIKISGLFKTTSMSKSENSFFRRHLNQNADLVQLYMYYVGAMEAQCSTYDTITLADETGSLNLFTQFPIEHHASTVYTNKIFKENVQVEIVSVAATCLISQMYVENSINFYEVDDTVDGVSKVCYSSVDDEYTCSCKLFIRKALMCRHIFFVMRTMKLTRIPNKYIAARWSKLSRVVAPPAEHVAPSDSTEKSFCRNNHFFLELCKSMGHVRGDALPRKMIGMMKEMFGLRIKIRASKVEPSDARIIPCSETKGLPINMEPYFIREYDITLQLTDYKIMEGAIGTSFSPVFNQMADMHQVLSH